MHTYSYNLFFFSILYFLDIFLDAAESEVDQTLAQYFPAKLNESVTFPPFLVKTTRVDVPSYYKYFDQLYII